MVAWFLQRIACTKTTREQSHQQILNMGMYMNILQEQSAYRSGEPSALGRGIGRITEPLARKLMNAIPERNLRKVLDKADATADQSFLLDMTHDYSDLDSARTVADSVESMVIKMSTATGAASGWGGLLAMGADIPATLALALHAIRETGRAYGYGGDTESERAFRFRVLELAASDRTDRRQRRIAEIESVIRDDGSLSPEISAKAELVLDHIVERVVRSLVLSVLRKRATVLMPIVSTLTAATINNVFQQEVAKAARFAFQARAINRSVLKEKPERGR